LNKTKDLIGQKFNKLTVVKRVEKPKNQKSGAFWLCVCDCGNEKILKTSDLKSGRVKSCGCLLKEGNKGNSVLKLNGQKFGRLLVLSFAYMNRKHSYWNCLCDCGKNAVVIGSNLKNGTTQSCGCLRIEKLREACFVDLTGIKFNRLLVLRQIKYENKKKTYWECICDCGNKIIVQHGSLRSGNTQSCGCLSFDKLNINKINKDRDYVLINRIIKNYKQRAKNKNIEFNLSREYFTELVRGNCYYCGEIASNILINKTGEIFNYNGIDRIDSNKGYIENNVVSCCKICNKSKNNMPQNLFIEWLKKAYININNKGL